MLPDIDGLALSKHLQLRLPALRIILMTGSEISSYEYENSLGRDTPLVRKPFLVHGVLDLIRSRLPGRETRDCELSLDLTASAKHS
jgi:DNA-binding NtrC family response regulator